MVLRPLNQRLHFRFGSRPARLEMRFEGATIIAHPLHQSQEKAAAAEAVVAAVAVAVTMTTDPAATLIHPSFRPRIPFATERPGPVDRCICRISRAVRY